MHANQSGRKIALLNLNFYQQLQPSLASWDYIGTPTFELALLNKRFCLFLQRHSPPILITLNSIQNRLGLFSGAVHWHPI
jgi:hypothetical protein